MIKIESRNGMLAVTCPYSRTWVSFAKMRGGTWSDGVRQWLFDPRDEFAVRSTLIDRLIKGLTVPAKREYNLIGR